MTDSKEIYLTPQQIAEQLQVVTTTVYRWLRSGKLRGAHINRKTWRVTQGELENFVRRSSPSVASRSDN